MCPVGYPCELKSRVEAAGGALEACLVELAVSDDVREAYRRALTEGDLEGLRGMVSSALAAMAGLHQREMLAILLDGGFAFEQPIPGAMDKDGNVEIIGKRLIQNPRAIPFIELTKLLGFTGDQQAVTPKSRGENQRDVSLSRHLDWMREFETTSPGRGLQAPTEAPPKPLPGQEPAG
jgi:hypothetical protein